MTIDPQASGHWTDEQLIASLYGVGPENDHISTCGLCRERASAMQLNRERLDALNQSDELSFDFLAAQRRRVYAKMPSQPSTPLYMRTRASLASAAAILTISGGLLFYQHRQHTDSAAQQAAKAFAEKLSDAELSQDVARLAEDPEPQPTDPLHALFQE